MLFVRHSKMHKLEAVCLIWGEAHEANTVKMVQNVCLLSLSPWLQMNYYVKNMQCVFYIYIYFYIYFFKYETIVSRNGLSLGYSERDTSSVPLEMISPYCAGVFIHSRNIHSGAFIINLFCKDCRSVETWHLLRLKGRDWNGMNCAIAIQVYITRSNLFQNLKKLLTTDYIFLTLKCFGESSATELPGVTQMCDLIRKTS